jgi:integrase
MGTKPRRTVELNVTKIRQVCVPGPAAIDYSVEGVEGLLLRVEKSGTATFDVRYRVKGGKQRRMKIGRVGRIELRDAREAAEDIMRAVSRGGDPKQAKIEHDAGLTFSELWERRKTDNVELAPSTLQQYDYSLKRYATPRIGGKKVNDVTGQDVGALLDAIRDKRGKPKVNSRNNTLAAIGSTYAWARGTKLGVTADPTDGIDRKPQAPPRLRNVDDTELAKLWVAIGIAEGIEPTTRLALRVLLLTGQRNANITGCRVEWIKPSLDVANPWLVIPAAAMKVKKTPHQVPLVPSVAALFREAAALHPDSEFVFASSRSEAGDMSRRTIARAMEKVCAAAGVDDVHAHDFRTILTTWLAEHGVPEDVRKKITHHSATGMQAVYNKAMLKEPVRQALLSWTDHVEKVAKGAGSGAASNVAQLRA